MKNSSHKMKLNLEHSYVKTQNNFCFQSDARECFLFLQGQPIKVISYLSNQIPLSTVYCNDHLVLVFRGLFVEGPGNFSGRKDIFSLSVSKNGDVYAAETSCMKETSVHIKNT